MVSAVEPRWHGDSYQSRFFWKYAASLLDPQRPYVVQVTFEADGPKAFDDVVVRYDPGRAFASGPGRISADYHQIKWHANTAGRFGYADLAKPEFINAKTVSLLQRLRDAKRTAERGAAFHLVTTDRIADGDPLGKLVSGNDSSLRLQVLQVGKTARSEMGKVRKCWREHLELESDQELYELLEGFHIQQGQPDLETLRHQVSLQFRLVGLAGHENETVFLYDDAAKQLVSKKINCFDRAGFHQWCKDEKWYSAAQPKLRRSVTIATFKPRPTPLHMADADREDSLNLVDSFSGRWLGKGHSWEDVQAQVTSFLRTKLDEDPSMRLFLEAHSSIAYLAGSALRFKDGADVEVVQRGDKNPGIVWDSNDGTEGPHPNIAVHTLGAGDDVVLAVSFSRDVSRQVTEYAARHLPQAGTLINVSPAGGAGSSTITGGQHAATLAQLIATQVRDTRKPGITTHIFLAAPNAFAFLLGQQAEAIGRCVPYEFDFSGQVDGSYRPTFTI